VIDLFPDFVDVVRCLTPADIQRPQGVTALNLHRDTTDIRRDVRMAYAPFDHVNLNARIAIVGLTPGRLQASGALLAAKRALLKGTRTTRAAEEAKVFASFSGPMRSNLVQLMDSVGLADTMRLESTASLWRENAHLVHFTSALRYPVFVDGENWNGSNPNALRSLIMCDWLEKYTGQELSKLPNAILVPLGPKVTAMLEHLARIGLIRSEQILAGLPHPAGSNAERIKYFLGGKPAHLLSSKTNAAVLDTARETILARVRTFG
jgi:hypothetical protein